MGHVSGVFPALEATTCRAPHQLELSCTWRQWEDVFMMLMVPARAPPTCPFRQTHHVHHSFAFGDQGVERIPYKEQHLGSSYVHVCGGGVRGTHFSFCVAPGSYVPPKQRAQHRVSGTLL